MNMPKYLDAPQYLFDFYAASQQRLDSSGIFILEPIKQRLLDDVQYCLYREIRHFTPIHILKPKYTCKLVKEKSPFYNGYITVYKNGHAKLCKKSYKNYIKRCKGNFFNIAEDIFLHESWGWNTGYGGKNWAKIATAAIHLKSDKFKDIRKSINLIDNLIYQNHNNGKCLNKLYPNIQSFLNAKTRRKDSSWITSRASRKTKVLLNRINMYV